MLLIFKLLTLINKAIHKKKKRIVLYSNLGFRDNVKALYDYIEKNNLNKSYQIICVSDNFMKLKRNKNIRYVGLYTGLYYFFTSKYFFYCFGKYPIKPSKHQIVVNLWHGTPLKKIGNLEAGNKKDYNFFNYLLVNSDNYIVTMKNAFNAQSDQLLLCGSPRNDHLFTMCKKKVNKKRIIWMPTYRDLDTEEKSFIYHFTERDWNQINVFIRQLNVVIYFKPHPLEKQNFDLLKNFSNIQVITDEKLSDRSIDLYDLIGEMDAMLTDYSSVALDFLLLNRPIGYVIDDFDAYSRERGFIDTIQKSMFAGPKIVSTKDLMKFFKDVSISKDDWGKQRARLNITVNQYDTKGNNSKTILKRVGIKR